MVEVPDKISQIIEKFRYESELRNIHISKMYLFGSFAKGTQGKYSDIDLAVISNDFTGNRFLDYMKLAEPRVFSSIDLETHPFKPEDFNNENLFVREILKTGIEII